MNERRWTNKPPLLCRHFFARGQWTIDPERNRWIRRKFVSPQIMEIEIDSSSTVRYVFVSSRDVAYVTREENGAILVTRNTCFQRISMKFFSKRNLKFIIINEILNMGTDIWNDIWIWKEEFCDRNYVKFYISIVYRTSFLRISRNKDA